MPYTPHTKNTRPKEYIASVDNALRLITLLKEYERLTVSQVALELGVGVSTAHRLLRMLTYRNFAVATDNKQYAIGPALSLGNRMTKQGNRLVTIAQHRMQQIAAHTGETCHLTILNETSVTFLHSEEGRKVLHTPSRKGTSLPAHLNSAGIHMLTYFSSAELRGMYPELTRDEFDDLRKRVQVARVRGYGVNNRETEVDLIAIGIALTNDMGDVLGGLSVSIPSARFKQVHTICLTTLLKHTRALKDELVHTTRDEL